MKTSIVWLRRDLRLHMNTAIENAINDSDQVILFFNFDQNILNKLEKDDRRITFIIESLKDIVSRIGKDKLYISLGDPKTELLNIATKYQSISGVYFNEDYESYTQKRDKEVTTILNRNNIPVFKYRDTLFYSPDSLLNKKNKPYKVFTAFKNKWVEKWEREDLYINEVNISLDKILNTDSPIKLNNIYKAIGFKKSCNIIRGGRTEGLKKLASFHKNINSYHLKRDQICLHSTSNLSTYLRFGCLSLKDCLKIIRDNYSQKGSQVWLSELIWREFYFNVLIHNPHVEKEEYNSKYKNIKWSKSTKKFKAWCEGKTGVPIIDASMRCLNETGLMPNRARMITASFLCKNLHINWKWGEEYFAKKLLDFELASNNGNWQWVSGTGTDAAPYFRIFNPHEQMKKYDPDLEFVINYCPELIALDKKTILKSIDFNSSGSLSSYPRPILNYSQSRHKALSLYKQAY